MRRWGVVAILALVPAACADLDCVPTRTTAADAAVVVTGDAFESGVLDATLVIAGDDEPVTGADVRFFAELRNGERAELGESTTGADGRVRLDMKRRPLRAARVALARAYSAIFPGDGTLCASAGEAAFRLVKR